MVKLTTRMGEVEGLSVSVPDGEVQVFRGLRFAQPPVGDLRFRPPVAAEPWSGTYDATRFPNRSPQAPMSEILGPEEPGELNEDCLFLNVFTPAPAAGSGETPSRPVMVWIHGGAYVTGSANSYNGSIIAAQGDVVVVAINYRLGLLGFLDLSGHDPELVGSASNGIRDQILALEWVRDNISDFGGDPNNVTIFGESAGGGSVLGLMAAPAADGLYHKAIAHSPGGMNTPPLGLAGMLAPALGVDEAGLVDKLRSMTAEELVETHTAMGGLAGNGIDGTVVTRDPATAIAERAGAGVPLIAGTNHDEGTLFSAILGSDEPTMSFMGPLLAMNILDGADASSYVTGLKEQYPEDSPQVHFERIWVDLFRRLSIMCAEAATAAGPGGWLYRFDLPSTSYEGKMGATHASEIPFTFNGFVVDGADPLGFHDSDDPVVLELARNWSNTVLRFAHTGDPNGAGLPEWPRYDAASRSSLVLDAECRVESDLDAEHQRLWGDRS